MARKRRTAPVEISRLHVLAATDERAFLDLALELLSSGDRLAREAAVEALAERPLAGARTALRELYFELDADGARHDQGALMRTSIVRALRGIGDLRDRDVAVRACDAREMAFGEDIAWHLRAHGLRMLAEIDAELFPYFAVEHLDDTAGAGGEPANTAFQLLAAIGQHAPIYQWLLRVEGDTRVAAVFELFTQAPPEVVARFVARAAETAVRREDEAMCTLIAEAVVNLDLADSYGALARMLSAKISDELYNYLSVLLAGTNRRALLEILEEQLHNGRRPRIVAAALRIRPTPEQEAILRRWEEPD
jgi:hypothetical protein